MYEVCVTYMGETHTKKTANRDMALRWAEEAVYDIGAEYSVVYNPDGTVYAEYEL